MLQEMKQPSGQELPRASASERVLITGIDGFTGRWLSQLLQKQGFTVGGTTIENIKGNSIYHCDIRNTSQLTSVIDRFRPQYIIHLAALSFAGHNDESLLHEINAGGTLSLFRSVGSCGISVNKIIVAGSATVYGNQGEECLHEAMKPAPTNAYGRSKLEAENIALDFSGTYPVIVSRPFNYTGPGQSTLFLVPKIVEHFRQRSESILLGNINTAREFNHVSDVCAIYLRLMLSDASGLAVNICSGKATFTSEIIQIMNRLSGYSIKVESDESLFRHGEIEILRGSPELLKSLVDAPFHMDTESILKQMYISQETDLD